MPDKSSLDSSSKEESNPEPSSSLGGGQIGRRQFLKSTAAGLLATAIAGPGCIPTSQADSSFQSRWPADVGRHWIGPSYWTNPLQDWRLEGGRVEMIGGGPNRNVQHLTRQIGAGQGTLDLRVLTGFMAAGSGRAGFEIGVQGPLQEYRNNAIHGEGLKAGLTADGRIFVGKTESKIDRLPGNEGAALHLTAASEGGEYTIALSVLDATSGEELGGLQHEGVSEEELVGNLALFAGADDSEEVGLEWAQPRLWFREWEVGGTKLEVHEDRAFGPILFSQHTLSRGVMKMTAQLPPMGEADDSTVRLQVHRNGGWETVAEEEIHELARTATFRIEDWNDTRDVPYRLAYRYRMAEGWKTHHYRGTVRRDPVDQDEIVLGGLSCATDPAFPHREIAEGVRFHDPDVLAFTGDQYYESTGGYGVERLEGKQTPEDLERATLDVLRKWYLHGWSFGELMRDRPTICLLDDHDVYQGNIWGDRGTQVDQYELHNDGGYLMPATWVNAVQRMQTSHLPDPYDPTPVRNDITVYYTDMLYGRVSFALLEDRKWKSGPDGLVPPSPGRPDHIKDPEFDPASVDLPEATLLGERQLSFLEDWAADWRGTDMKAVISQSTFAQVPTHHGGEFMRLVADLDSNGWPQTPRNEALRRMRKGFAFHIGGDQHLPMVLRYGVEDWNDAPYNFCVPGICVGYVRAFWPEQDGKNPRSDVSYHTGQYTDGLGNKVTVRAVANPREDFREESPLQEAANKSSGYGIIRFDTSSRQITMESWPIRSDPRKGESEQYEGWPETIDMKDNDPREPVAHLPTLSVTGTTNPMVQVVDEERDEVVYTLRIQGPEFRPKVFRKASHTVRVGDDEAWRETLEGVQPEEAASSDVLEVTL